jgi:23S rRNA pseudouridine1911/1915/1917 synthase
MASERQNGRSGRPAPPAPHAPLEAHAFTADRGDEGVRLDLVLLRYVRGRLALSRRRLQAAIESGCISVNGAPAHKTAARVTAGDRIDALLPARRRREPARAQDLPLDVVFEDEHLLVLNKASGMVVHPAYKHAHDTLFNAVLWHVGDGCTRPRLLNRLDKDTSGIVLMSKSREAHEAIVRAMRGGAVRKEYLAIVHGTPRPARGTVTMRLRRDPNDIRRVSRAESGGKESVTRYETLSQGTAHENPVSLVRCELVTGRMHQIRVHLAARGWPVVGDRVYGAGRAAMEAGAGSWHALHAWRVSLAHPITGEPLTLVAPLPDDLRTLMNAARLQIPTEIADRKP